MKDEVTKVSILFYCVINIILAIIFIIMLGSFLITMYGLLINQLLKLLT